ncbi:PR5-like receptor kinase isoform X2 [Pyrus x bretschneideri]|uniref:PR5-like receptor kinase isoform X2 n=1 Tax=Pyrus x bretschneideri TaxID=225117 RepID=UPI0020301E25|nr:PR5-like receptor kinase isoform X2 [Pyrus x bretschneideri]
MMKCLVASLLGLTMAILFFSGAHAAKMTFTNNCPNTVWPATLTSGQKPQLSTTGFKLASQASQSMDAPSPWSGRLWARTRCSTNATGKFSCETADCGSGQVACNGAYAVTPTTLVEITIAENGGQDFYDVSLVDGFNLPMSVAPQGGTGECQTSTCHVNVNAACPIELQVKAADKSVISCMSACMAFNESQYCCTPPNDVPSTCPSTNYSQFFKKQCPEAYSYAYDDQTSTFTCNGGPDYIITFCPNGPLAEGPTPPTPSPLTPSPLYQPPISSGAPSSLPKPLGAPSSLPKPPGAPSSLPKPSGKGKPIKLIVSLTIVCFNGVLGAIVFGLCRMRAKQKGHIKLTRERIKLTRDNLQEYIGGKHDLSELRIYDFDSILVATDNFSTENKLGQGGFGPVYKGKLAEGKEIAVKRLSSTSGQGVVEFKNEMLLISNLQHKNLVRIMGCCVKEDEKLLIYEFMPNKSLDTFLFDSMRRAVLDWGTRFNIIQGVARGLVYLHHDSYLKVIHRDLKVSNILLDEKMNPKISDFGLARSVEGTQNLENTQRVVGTRGYMSPEYAMGGIFSQKSDVYSFGILVLEIISSKKNTAFYIYDQQLGLLAYAWQLWKEGRELELVDEMLAADSYSAPEVMQCVHIGLLCVQDNPTDRPSMPDVIFMLNGSTTVIGGPQPKKPLFTIQNSVSHPQPQPSNNEATMTMIEGR